MLPILDGQLFLSFASLIVWNKEMSWNPMESVSVRKESVSPQISLFMKLCKKLNIIYLRNHCLDLSGTSLRTVSLLKRWIIEIYTYVYIFTPQAYYEITDKKLIWCDPVESGITLKDLIGKGNLMSMNKRNLNQANANWKNVNLMLTARTWIVRFPWFLQALFYGNAVSWRLGIH